MDAGLDELWLTAEVRREVLGRHEKRLAKAAAKYLFDDGDVKIKR